VEGKSTETDTAGYFEIQDIPAGKWTLQASKDHFSLVSQSVNIIQNVTAKISIPMVSVILTSKITGIVKGQDSLPIAGARIIMLNPDGKESGIMATSDESGSYRLWYVPFGRRRIVVNRNQTAEFGFDEVMLDLSVTEPEHPLDIEMRKYSLEGKFTDGRDNHEYAYRVMGKQTWMAENLAFLPAVSPAKDGSESVSRYYVQGYEGNIVADAKLNENFSVYGALYNWTAAQGACPRGWHLPGDAEWKTLENFLGPDPGYGMKSIFGWVDHGNGNNSTGFNVLPAGKRNDKGGFTGTEPGIFGSLGYSAHFWLTTIVLGHGAWTRSFYSDDNNVYRVAESLAVGLSVRCLKD
jgi:uncharacterized protein (TIGR02145 family)